MPSSSPIRIVENPLDRFEELLSASDAVDIAVAWATHCPAIAKLRAFCARKGSLRIIVGVDGSATDPTTLKDLAGFAHLRIGIAQPPASGIFHPKYYCFRKSSRSIVWVGSANLTCSGFGGNEELMLETAGSTDTQKWFESLWRSLPADPREAIDAYARNWKPQSERQQQRAGGRSRLRRQSQSAPERLDSSWSWDDYVANLTAKDEEMLAVDNHKDGKPEEPWTVFGETRSWMNTIRVGHPITGLQSWRSLKRWQTDVLVGRSPWGALGTLKGAGMACSIITGNSARDREVRRDILQQLQSTTEDGDDAIRFGVEALVGMRKLGHRIGSGVATRLLALARPECYVSLNGASRDGLAKCSDLAPTTLDRRYDKLLEWVHGSTWYGAPRPSDSREGEIWDYRAALVDAFVYEA